MVGRPRDCGFSGGSLTALQRSTGASTLTLQWFRNHSWCAAKTGRVAKPAPDSRTTRLPPFKAAAISCTTSGRKARQAGTMIVLAHGRGPAETLEKRTPPAVSADSYPAKDSGNVHCCCASSSMQSGGSSPETTSPRSPVAVFSGSIVATAPVAALRKVLRETSVKR